MTRWVPILTLLMAVLPLLVPATDTYLQKSPRRRLKGANRRSNWQKHNAKRPAAHVIATRGSRRNTLEWRSEDDVAFIQKMEQPMSTTLVAPRPGLYYIYCQVGFVGTDTHLLLLSQVLTWDEATNQNVSLILGTESVSAPPWRASLTLGGLVHLQGEQRLYVHVSHPQFVDYSEGKTFFGVIKIS